MAFINPGGTGVIAFSDYEDVVKRDQRLFEANEFTVPAEFTNLADMIESYTERATTKILYFVKDTDWWKSYYLNQSGSTLAALNVYQTLTGVIDVPVPDANKFIGRQQDWTDLCVYITFYEYVLPLVADFSKEDNAEYKKIGFYKDKFNTLFAQLIAAGDWYDWSGSGVVTNDEKSPTVVNLVRKR